MRLAVRTAMLAVIATLFFAGQVQAATFTVNSTAGTPDAGINGDCDSDPTADDDCTLVAAVQEANATAAADVIVFSQAHVAGDPDDAAFVAGQPSGLVTIGGAVPTITHPLSVFGGNCSTDPFNGSSTPCAIVSSGWQVNADGDVEIEGLVFQGGGTAIEVSGVTGGAANLPDFELTNSWFGVDMNGAKTVPPATDVLLENVDGAHIGEANRAPNLFARQGTAVDIFGADDTVVKNNQFGVLPDGSFARAGESASANGDNIEVSGNSQGTATKVDDDQATGTVIGVSNAFLAGTPACDGGCNLIDSAGQSATNIPQSNAGIDLEGEAGEDEIPAHGAQIVGNQIGTGSSSKPGNATAIVVGDADNVQIGGSGSGNADRNTFGANDITSGSGSHGLLVQNNVMGQDPSNPTLSLQGSGEVLDNNLSSGSSHAAIQLASTSAPGFTVQGNVIGEALDGSAQFTGLIGINLTATASGNTIGGTGAGDGNVISDLVTSNPATLNTHGIRIAGDNNNVIGNRIGVGSDGSPRKLLTGIELITDADNNTIGGDTAAAENLISNVADDAIVVTNANSDGNQILRNHGSSNGDAAGDLFIDLGDDGVGNLAEPNGPNTGVQAPAITSASATTATGTAAPGATVRVFSKVTAGAGEVEGFLTQATATGAGAWSATLPAQPDGKLLVATETVGTNTSELSTAKAVDAAAPQTTIDSGPGEGTTTADSTPTFGFSSNEGGSTFECRIDGGTFGACSGPDATHTPAALPDGAHTFEVRGTDGVGNIDASPASVTFTVDTISPETTIDSGPGEGTTTADPTPTLGFSASEDGSSFECRLDGGAFGPCSGPDATHTPAPLGDGQHTFEVRSTDAVGNVDASPAARSFTVDATAPQTLINKHPKKTLKLKGKKKKAKAKFTFSSTEAGSSFSCKLDKQGFKPCTSPKALKLKKGRHTFSVVATDAVGNADASAASFTLKVKKARKHHHRH